MRRYEAKRTPAEMAKLASKGLAEGVTIEHLPSREVWVIMFEGVCMAEAGSLIGAICVGRQFEVMS